MAAVGRVPQDRRTEPGVVPGWSGADHVWACRYWADDAARRIDDDPFDLVPPTDYVEITTICSDATPTSGELPCRLPLQRMLDRDSLVTIFLEHNGFIKGGG